MLLCPRSRPPLREALFRKRKVTAPPKGGRIDDAPSPPEGEDKNSHIGVRSRLTTRQLLKRGTHRQERKSAFGVDQQRSNYPGGRILQKTSGILKEVDTQPLLDYCT